MSALDAAGHTANITSRRSTRTSTFVQSSDAFNFADVTKVIQSQSLCSLSPDKSAKLRRRQFCEFTADNGVTERWMKSSNFRFGFCETSLPAEPSSTTVNV